ncbi:MAG: ribulose-phosphate 3-epimerase [Acidaminococcaceae bacterium]|nr:ribulose-phosphate 3-epimerase [Acidaminococcaceae bacterium]
MPGKISASMMCASLLNLEDDIRQLEKAGVEYLHIDIMDGVFVPNIMLSNSFIRAVRSITGLPLDIHLMITQPENKLEWFDIQENDIVAIHYESTSNVEGTLQMIGHLGAHPAVALSPATPIEVISYLLEDLYMVNIMAVNPGFSGRTMVPMTLQKINDTRDFLNRKGKTDIMIEADGNVTFEHAMEMRKAGADMFVGGSSSLFDPRYSITEAVTRLRNSIL